MSIARPASPGRLPLFALLGFASGLPLVMFSTVLALRLQAAGAALVVIGFFAWVQLLPSAKFLWAPLLDRYDVPGFARCWGRRRGWILLALLGIATALAGLGMSDPRDLRLTAGYAVLLAFWTTTLDIAVDAWRIEQAPTPEAQGPIAAANLWGYRSAMVAAGSGALLLADRGGWGIAYLVVAGGALLPFPLIAMMKGEGRRTVALLTGLLASAAILTVVGLVAGGIAWGVVAAGSAAGIGAATNVTPYVLVACMLPFVAMAIALPRIRRAGPTSRLRTSLALGPYVEFFRRYDHMAIVLLAFVSLYRMGDVLAVNLSKPMIRSLGYSLTQIGLADSYVAFAATIAGIGAGGWIAARWSPGRGLVTGACFAAIGNLAFVWLAHCPPVEAWLYLATAADQFGNAMAAAVFVVYLSMLVDPRFAGAQYAFLSGFAFLLPRLLAGAGGGMVVAIGYDGFFLLSALLSLAAILFVPFVARPTPPS
ncbi:MFS transporter [Sphingomonas sp. Leaf4]|uniref:MFS transporter n=1 Tax=Sphingomonas sp. Leaf4 TaxID=2876553 RepID=UPI001E387A32|nr:MFS transporter [Sphingomonas sp. Leaf4]